jgi:hypothetical protein
MNYGNNGIETYGGNNDDLRGHNYYPQNMYKPHNISSTVYIVNGEGHITRSLTKEQILPYLKAKKIDGVSALKKMGAEESVIKDYIKRLEELKFSYKNFEADSILYIVATVNGEKLIYLNSNLKRCVDDININPTDFLAIAREKYKKELNENKSLKQKNTIKLTEEDLHFIIKESVTKILEENFNIKKTTDKIKKGVKNFGNGIKDGLKKVKQKYDDEVERVLNAPNPLYDDDEEFDESDN